MKPRSPLSQAEKERIYRGKLAGRRLSDLAKELGCTVECVRKWWRIGRKHGEAGLRTRRAHRGKAGILSQFDPRIGEEAVKLKRVHPGWGPKRVGVELRRDPVLQRLAQPSRSRIACLFKQQCPECLAPHNTRSPQPIAPPAAYGVHEVWQVDNQEHICLRDGSIATICSIRDPFGAAMIASRAFAVQTEHHWRKLSWQEIRDVIRLGCAEWHTLPDRIRTDNELVLAGRPDNPFPAPLTLWLAGMGIAHDFIRPGCPTDQPEIERNHRTLANWAQDETSLGCLADLQSTLDREREQYNLLFPATAHGCDAQPPLTAHPQLCQPRRPFTYEMELVLFDLQRVFDYLTVFLFRRKLHPTTAHISLGDHLYCLSRPLMRAFQLQTVRVRMDPRAHQWVVMTDDEQQTELLRLAPIDLDVEYLTGLKPQSLSLPQPMQLVLPFWLPAERGTITIGL